MSVLTPHIQQQRSGMARVSHLKSAASLGLLHQPGRCAGISGRGQQSLWRGLHAGHLGRSETAWMIGVACAIMRRENDATKLKLTKSVFRVAVGLFGRSAVANQVDRWPSVAVLLRRPVTKAMNPTVIRANPLTCRSRFNRVLTVWLQELSTAQLNFHNRRFQISPPINTSLKYYIILFTHPQ
jgi:hypothetical protein